MQALRQLRWKIWGLSFALGLSMSSVTWAASPPPIYTKNATLRLPVQIDERTRSQITEVKLYVRQETGNWKCNQTSPANATAFDFKSEGDGKYYFTFVTVDRRGRAEPADLNKVDPHRVVIIDTKAPEISAQPFPLRGERMLQVHVRDLNPDWPTLRVSYLANDQTWKPLTVAAVDTPTLFRVPNASVFESKIRVTVNDRAGNNTSRELDLGDPTANFGFNGSPTVNQGKPDPTLIPNMESTAPDIRPPVLDPYPSIRQVEAQTPIKLPEPINVPEPIKAPLIINGNRDLPPIPDINTPKLPDQPVIRNGNRDLDIKMPSLVKEPSTLPPGINEDLKIELPADVNPNRNGSPIQTTAALKPIDLPKPANAKPPIELPKELAVPTPPPIPEPIFEGKGPATHKIINSRSLTINYKVEGTRGNNRIDFWATQDQGKSWIALRDESAGVSPAKLTLPADGFYGIRIRPGAGSRPPEVGEDPDLVIEIDSTKPVVNLMQPVIGTGSDDGTMLISWTASDKNLLSNSVNLWYAHKPDGPWEVIVSGYKNAGQYRWTLPTQLSGNVFVRLEVSDRAGNVGQHDYKSPVTLETIKPRVTIVDVGPSK